MKSNDEIMSALQAKKQSLEREIADKTLIIEDFKRKHKNLEENIGRKRDEKEAEIENLRKDSSKQREDILSLKREI